MPTVLVPVAESSEDVETSTITNVLVRAGVTVLPLATMPEGHAAYDAKDLVMARKLVFRLPATLAQYVERHHGGSVDKFVAGLDAVLIPGGMPGATYLSQSALLSRIIVAMHLAGKLVGAICAAPHVVLSPLASQLYQGIAGDLYVTAYPSFRPKVEEVAREQQLTNLRWSDDPVALIRAAGGRGSILTSQGPGTAWHFALCAVALLSGQQAAIDVMNALLVPQCAPWIERM